MSGSHGDGAPVTVVFAIPKWHPPDEIRMSIVDADGVPAPLPAHAAAAPTPS